MTLLLAYSFSIFFFFNDTATTEIYTLSLHDALPISPDGVGAQRVGGASLLPRHAVGRRSEEHTSELQSLTNLVCRLLLEKKKITWHPVADDYGRRSGVLSRCTVLGTRSWWWTVAVQR